ncbi:MAG: chromosome segregation SMC family protein [Nanoarchaeota archaeon]|nr:chromosome segregation SMC family protein [Nanoarchaeota archaeon]
MVYVKRLVMHGFKSFARKTEIEFGQGINVILGPNGSGKSNVSDALCFVLGRLSIKSMRAAKARNLLFMGSKYIKPAREAVVEIVFDNSDKAFAIDKNEISLKRTVKYNGQSTYKINEETKTRIEVIEMLAQAGIDPYGFNLVLQGQIQAIVKMHPEDRRKIIEEVAGIAIYESRKEKSLNELGKTEERLKEIGAILRERTAYLKNLDKERTQALRFKELEMTVKRSKASILSKKIKDKEKELDSLKRSIEDKLEQQDSYKKKVEKTQEVLSSLNRKIEEITKHIQKSTGLEQETLHESIANLRAEIEGLKVRKENYENRVNEIQRRINEMKNSTPGLEAEIGELKKESPMMAKKGEELKKKKEELAIIEEEKKKMHTIKSELNNIRERIKDRERMLARNGADSDNIVKQLGEYEKLIKFKSEEECLNALKEYRKNLDKNLKELEIINKDMVGYEKSISIAESDLSRAEKIAHDVSKIDTCPLCQSKITEEHISHVNSEQVSVISRSKELISDCVRNLKNGEGKSRMLKDEIREFEVNISEAERESIRHRAMKDKHEQLKRAVEEDKIIRNELNSLESKRKSFEEKSNDAYSVEERYQNKIMEIEEISARTEEDIDTTILYKQRELENMHSIIKRSSKDIEELGQTISEITNSLKNKMDGLSEKEGQEQELQKRFKTLFEERESTQHQIQESNLELSEINQNIRAIEDQVNYLKIGRAKLDAEKESLEMELSDYANVELVQGSIDALEEKMKKAQESLMQIGSINMRALDVYEEVKKEYDIVFEKTQTLEREKLQIMEIIAEIDNKKKRTFMKTFKAMSDLFSENFAKLYTKGVAFLELENKEDIFAGGVNIVVRLAKGKYFDVTSLSGGEQTLVALSLLFAIQEYKPYHFYIFDEIDAALDKRNSERLAVLLNRYMKSGQYIVITHNDAIIMNANTLYGVSMHEQVSKVLSLNLQESLKEVKQIQESEGAVKPEITIDSAPLSEQTLEEGSREE